MKLPIARSENIVVQHLNDEVLIYNTSTNQAFCLNETSAKVFNACNGKTTFEDLKRQYKFTDDLIYLALDELRKQNLLDESANYQSPFNGMNRREVIKKVGLATMIALPIISAMIAPTAANAASNCYPVCVEAGNNYCVGCIGQTIYVAYNEGTNCTGPIIGPLISYTCTRPVTVSPGYSLKRN